MLKKILLLSISMCCVLCPSNSAIGQENYWDNQFGFTGIDPNGYVMDIEVLGDDVYICGQLGIIDNYLHIGNFVRWDGANLHRPGNGIGGFVRTIASDGTSLYVAGDFSVAGGVEANRVACWNGLEWSALGDGVMGDSIEIFTIEVFAGDVFVGGTSPSGGFLSQWNGTNWIDHSNMFSLDDSVMALASTDTHLYVGGDFLTVGVLEVNGIAYWDGSSWGSMGSGLPGGTVLSIDASAADVYVGGYFHTSGDPALALLQKWDGMSWNEVGGGVSSSSGWEDSYVNDLFFYNGTVYVAGNFDRAGADTAYQIAGWDGVNWVGNSISTMPRYGIFTIAMSDDGIYVGFGSTSIGGVEASGIAVWDGTVWYPVTSAQLNGVDDRVQAFAETSDGYVVAGGQFDRAGGEAIPCLAVFDGSKWNSVGGGIEGYEVDDVLVDGNTIYACGAISAAGGSEARNIVAWDGSSWDYLDGGLNGATQVMCLFNGDLHVGGSVMSNNSISGHVMHWNGTEWRSIGTASGPTYIRVYSMQEHNGCLYIGGYFTSVDGVSASNIACWNGEVWSAVGDGFDAGVFALASFGGELYAGGIFSNSGSDPTSGIARWDGARWVEVGGGTWGSSGNKTVRSMYVWRSSLFIGGSFAWVGPDLTPAYGVAEWTGSEWNLFGGTWDGSFPGVRDVVVTSQGLFVGGTFYRAGGRFSRRIGRYSAIQTDAETTTPPDACILEQNYPNPFNPLTRIRLSLPRTDHVKLTVYNVKGEYVSTLIDQYVPKGRTEIIWEATNDEGMPVASGLYFYRLVAGDFVQTKKMVLLR